MNSESSIISKLWRKLFSRQPGSPSAATQRPTRLDGTPSGATPQGRKPRPGGIEMLEGRIAPATLINPTTLVYTDIDGDQVTVKFSKALFKDNDPFLATYINSVFKFSTGGVHLDAANDPGTPQQLQLIDLTKIPTIGFGAKEKSPAAGVSFSVIAEKADTLIPGEGDGPAMPGQDGILDGDGLANVGAINALSSLNSFGLGKVTIDGDLAQIDAGTGKTKVGLKALKVHSLGAVAGTQTGTGAAAIESKIFGEIGSITVTTDIQNASIYAASALGSKVKAIGKIGNITIGSALQGTAIVASSSNDTGLIRSDTSIGNVKIGSGAEGDGIIGGGGTNSGSIIAGTKLKSVTVNGDVVGGGGTASGSIYSIGNMGTVKVTGDVYVPGTIITGGTLAASIKSIGNIGKVIIDGNLQGGVAANTGVVIAEGNLGQVTIGGDVIGGGGRDTGGVSAMGKLNKLTVGGDILGGAGQYSGHVEGLLGIGSVKIKGDLKGNPDFTGEKNAIIASMGSINSIVIDGSLIGGEGASSGVIQAGLSGTGTLKSVVIGGKIIGGDGAKSGAIISESKIGKIVVKATGGTASLEGGDGHFSGAIFGGSFVNSVKLLGGVIGGDGNDSGTVVGLVKSLSITGDLKGGIGAGSGSIQGRDLAGEVAGDLGKINISGSLLAGTGARSGAIYADGNIKSVVLGGIDTGVFETGAAGEGSSAIFSGYGMVNPGDVGSIRVLGAIEGRSESHTLLEIRGSLGSLEARGGISNGEIHVGDRLGSVTVGVSGRNPVEANIENVLLTAGGTIPSKAKNASSIASITVNGDVTGSQILAGYDVDGEAVNSSARIGKVKVAGDWIASSLVAGIAATNEYFGDGDDAVIGEGNPDIVSQIASVVIGGSVSGSADPTDHFGFVAQQIGTFKVGGATIPDNDLAEDVKVSEVSA